MTDLGMLYKKLLAVYKELGSYEQKYTEEFHEMGAFLDKIWWDLPETDRESIRKRLHNAT